MEPPAKRRSGREISFTELQSLSYAITHFPPCTPTRWHLISQYVNANANPMDMLLYGINGSGKRFDRSPMACQIVANLLGNDIPDVVDFFGPFCHGSDTRGFMPVVLPPVCQCCGLNLLIRNRPSHARVYTTHGTDIAAVFTGECRNPNCQMQYHYSYMETGCTGQTERYYYCLAKFGQPYFQLTSKTIFGIDFLKDVSLNLKISWASLNLVQRSTMRSFHSHIIRNWLHLSNTFTLVMKEVIHGSCMSRE